MSLTQSDVDRLARASSPRVRAEVAGKVALGFSDAKFGGREKDVAIEIFRLLMRDAEVKVREALSHNLSRCADLPHDVALRLAQDVEEVSVPILEFSTVLEDVDLIAIVESSHELAKLSAIARREVVAEPVSDALLEANIDKVAAELYTNKGALISETAMLRSIERMADNESVIDALMERGNLPVTCVEKIFLTVSDYMKKQLIERHHFSRHLVEGRMEYAREWATIGVTGSSEDSDIEALVKQLHDRHKLTSSIVIRSLCAGDLVFFEQALAVLAGVPVDNVRKLMQDAGPLGFQSLYKLSPLPPTYFDAVKKLKDIVLEETENGKSMPNDFSDRVVDNIVSNGYDLSIECMPLLLAIIKGNASELSSIH